LFPQHTRVALCYRLFGPPDEAFQWTTICQWLRSGTRCVRGFDRNRIISSQVGSESFGRAAQ